MAWLEGSGAGQSKRKQKKLRRFTLQELCCEIKLTVGHAVASFVEFDERII